jgi:hypothetical protein
LMYAGVIVLLLCIPLVLGSWLALLLGAANPVLMVIRARQEAAVSAPPSWLNCSRGRLHTGLLEAPTTA